MVRTRRGLEAEVLRFFAATPARRPANPTFLGHDGRFCSPNMHPNVLPPRSAISRVVRLLPGARFRAAHPPRPHVGSGVHRRGGLGWVKGRRAYEQSPGPIVSRAGTRLRSPCGAATRQAQADSHNRFNTFVKLSLALLSFLWHAPDVPCSQGLISSSLERFPTFFTNLRNGGGGGGGGGGVHAHLLIKLPQGNVHDFDCARFHSQNGPL